MTGLESMASRKEVTSSEDVIATVRVDAVVEVAEANASAVTSKVKAPSREGVDRASVKGGRALGRQKKEDVSEGAKPEHPTTGAEASPAVSIPRKQQQERQQRLAARSSNETNSPKVTEVDSADEPSQSTAQRSRKDLSSSSSGSSSGGGNDGTCTAARIRGALSTSSGTTQSIVVALIRAVEEIAKSAASPGFESDPTPPAVFFEEVEAERHLATLMVPVASDTFSVPSSAQSSEEYEPSSEEYEVSSEASEAPGVRAACAGLPRPWPDSTCTVVGDISPLSTMTYGSFALTRSPAPPCPPVARHPLPPEPVPTEVANRVQRSTTAGAIVKKGKENRRAKSDDDVRGAKGRGERGDKGEQGLARGVGTEVANGESVEVVAPLTTTSVGDPPDDGDGEDGSSKLSQAVSAADVPGAVEIGVAGKTAAEVTSPPSREIQKSMPGRARKGTKKSTVTTPATSTAVARCGVRGGVSDVRRGGGIEGEVGPSDAEVVPQGQEKCDERLPRPSSANSRKSKSSSSSNGTNRRNRSRRYGKAVAARKPALGVFDMPSDDDGDNGDIVSGEGHMKHPEKSSSKRRRLENGIDADVDVGRGDTVRNARTETAPSRDLDPACNFQSRDVSGLRSSEERSSAPAPAPPTSAPQGTAEKKAAASARLRDGSSTPGGAKTPTRRCHTRTRSMDISSTPPEPRSGKNRKTGWSVGKGAKAKELGGTPSSKDENNRVVLTNPTATVSAPAASASSSPGVAAPPLATSASVAPAAEQEAMVAEHTNTTNETGEAPARLATTAASADLRRRRQRAKGKDRGNATGVRRAIGSSRAGDAMPVPATESDSRGKEARRRGSGDLDKRVASEDERQHRADRRGGDDDQSRSGVSPERSSAGKGKSREKASGTSASAVVTSKRLDNRPSRKTVRALRMRKGSFGGNVFFSVLLGYLGGTLDIRFRVWACR